MKKTCGRCKIEQDISEFYSRFGTGHPVTKPGDVNSMCKTCHQASGIERARARRQRIRDEVFAGYGGKCACCGESNPAFLVLDHVEDDGADHRREVAGGQGNGSGKVYQWAIKHGFPDRLQLLCANCNTAKMRGVCPHLTPSQQIVYNRRAG